MDTQVTECVLDSDPLNIRELPNGSYEFDLVKVLPKTRTTKSGVEAESDFLIGKDSSKNAKFWDSAGKLLQAHIDGDIILMTGETLSDDKKSATGGNYVTPLLITIVDGKPVANEDSEPDMTGWTPKQVKDYYATK